MRTLGGALIGRLILSAQDRGVRLECNVRARRLSESDGRITGLEVETPDGPRHVTALRGVVLASGGFEWSEELQRAFLPSPVTPTSQRINEGDGLKMALRVGAQVERMSQVLGRPRDPGPGYTSTRTGRRDASATSSSTLPGAIAVNPRGERFVNEAINYHDLSKAFNDQDVERGGMRNQPASR